MEFFSMGMFCIDEIHTPEKSYYDVIGGAGTYAVLGAGLALPPAQRTKVVFICDEGRDFPQPMKQEIESWGLGTIFRQDMSRETTKAWNKFVNNEERLFKYLSPKRQIVAQDLAGEPSKAKCIHLICSPARCDEFMAVLRGPDWPNSHQPQQPSQTFVWEPVPTECTPSNFKALKKTITTWEIDVLTPNALEMAAFVGKPEPLTYAEVEAIVDDFYAFAPSIVVRCGALGSFLRTTATRKWYPAYFSDQSKVVDPSGAGNAFSGGLGAALGVGYGWDDAIAAASVSASYVIEQVGPPKLVGGEWNGQDPQERLEIYKEKVRESERS